jgi:hypothetical protein
MAWQSAFLDGPLDVIVSYSDSLLFTGSMAIGDSQNFPDANSDFNCTLSVDADGIVSLTSSADPTNWTGGKYTVSIATPDLSGFAGMQLLQCASDPDVFGGTTLSAISDDSSTDFEGSSFVYTSLPTIDFGMGAVPGGS